jgi:predicted phage terminase large subunit-like protein
MKLDDLDLLEKLAHYEARTSFYAYRQYINPKMKLGWWQREIAHALQQFMEDLQAGKRPKLVIEAPPQHGKSQLIIDFLSWLAGHNPDCRTIYTSFSERLGIRANLRLQRIYDSPKYQKLFRDTIINGSNAGTSSTSGSLRNREILEYAGRDGYFRNTTVGGPITGESLDLGVIDDPIKGREQARSQTLRDKTWEWLTDDFLTRFSEAAGLLIILTRWHVDDPIGRLKAADPSIKTLSYQAIATVDEPNRQKGEALFPAHKSLDFLLSVKAVMSASSWEALYQQRPFIEEGEFFQADKLAVIDAIPVGTTFCRAWDLAATADDGDYTVGAKLGKMPDGRTLISDVIRFQGSPDRVREAVLNAAGRDSNRTKIRLPQDPGQAGKAQAQSFVRMLSGYTTNVLTVSGEKTTRAEPFASQVNASNVVMLRAGWNDAFVDELRMFPNGPHDDQVDAGSDAFTELHGGGCGADSLFAYLEKQYNEKMKEAA